ncbi:hypothetical protein Glove_321g45 [Diversispora epigaea]|uniref:Alpha-1,3-glucosyltransferase n=1 Tax=Diversispora epigaea TaxID=1348612 RepID=A0A397HTL3_9GLOM|nr:hypothetical protein Glove_321g45 [Diversispora epigaea]
MINYLETLFSYAKEGNDFLCGLMFAILLNFKHIFLYLSPAYFVYLLRHYCFQKTGGSEKAKFCFVNFFVLGITVILIFSLSFGPFIYMGQIWQVLSRLFPFKRGLCHAYWAPNFWSLYSFVDRGLIVVSKKLGGGLNELALSSITRGLVGDSNYAILPQIQANHTFIITLVFQAASLVKLWKYPNFKNFIGSLISCGYSSFLFGWHVHEKAILMVMVPFGLIATESLEHFRAFMILSTSGLFSLFPLLFRATESIIKMSLCALWIIFTYLGLSLYVPNKIKFYPTPKSKISMFIYLAENIYVCGFVVLQFFCGVLHQIVFKNEYEFLPLLVTSVYCALGIVYSWFRFTLIYFLGK